MVYDGTENKCAEKSKIKWSTMSFDTDWPVGAYLFVLGTGNAHTLNGNVSNKINWYNGFEVENRTLNYDALISSAPIAGNYMYSDLFGGDELMKVRLWYTAVSDTGVSFDLSSDGWKKYEFTRGKKTQKYNCMYFQTFGTAIRNEVSFSDFSDKRNFYLNKKVYLPNFKTSFNENSADYMKYIDTKKKCIVRVYDEDLQFINKNRNKVELWGNPKSAKSIVHKYELFNIPLRLTNMSANKYDDINSTKFI